MAMSANATTPMAASAAAPMGPMGASATAPMGPGAPGSGRDCSGGEGRRYNGDGVGFREHPHRLLHIRPSLPPLPPHPGPPEMKRRHGRPARHRTLRVSLRLCPLQRAGRHKFERYGGRRTFELGAPTFELAAPPHLRARGAAPASAGRRTFERTAPPIRAVGGLAPSHAGRRTFELGAPPIRAVGGVARLSSVRRTFELGARRTFDRGAPHLRARTAPPSSARRSTFQHGPDSGVDAKDPRARSAAAPSSAGRRTCERAHAAAPSSTAVRLEPCFPCSRVRATRPEKPLRAQLIVATHPAEVNVFFPFLSWKVVANRLEKPLLGVRVPPVYLALRSLVQHPRVWILVKCLVHPPSLCVQ